MGQPPKLVSSFRLTNPKVSAYLGLALREQVISSLPEVMEFQFLVVNTLPPIHMKPDTGSLVWTSVLLKGPRTSGSMLVGVKSLVACFGPSTLE